MSNRSTKRQTCDLAGALSRVSALTDRLYSYEPDSYRAKYLSGLPQQIQGVHPALLCVVLPRYQGSNIGPQCISHEPDEVWSIRSGVGATPQDSRERCKPGTSL